MDIMETAVQVIPYYAHPHVHVVINDNTFYEEEVAKTTQDEMPYATAVVTGADKGIDNKFVALTDLTVKQKIFGEGNFSKYGQSSIQADVLFNGQTKVWFMRVLPDDATFANIIILLHYRKGKILDGLGQETGKYRLEVKFSTVNVTSSLINGGAVNEETIEAYAATLSKSTADPKTGYMTVPLCYIRSAGRGKYGNDYSVSITRDLNAEKEYEMKMYDFNLIDNNRYTQYVNIFAGSLYQSVKYGVSTLIDDVLGQFSDGSTPIMIHSFESNFLEVYEYYKKIVNDNAKYLHTSGASVEDLDELKIAGAITEKTFDPIFGFIMNSEDVMPYYRNYTEKETAWVAPNFEVPNTAGAAKPLNISSWSSATVGSRVLVAADPLHDGLRWMYTVVGIDSRTGNIIYDEGEETELDDDQYTGTNLTQSAGHSLDGGSDGAFESVTINGETRKPTDAEMKLLLSKEYVKAFRGQKDRKILSPIRTNIDILFDANYNMSDDVTLDIDTQMVPLYNSSTVLTDKDAQQLAILSNSGYSITFADLNVKQAMYDLVTFRNKRGMKISSDAGAGCHLYLDCGIVGIKNLGVNQELANVITMLDKYQGRATSIDLGYYQIFDPSTGRKIKVTVTYFIAKKLFNHILSEGLNIPFTNEYAKLTAIQRDSSFITSGEMIRDSFYPDIDLIDWDVKEALYKSRINYWVAEDEGRSIVRAVQNTRQLDASALLEENNVRVLNKLVKNLERACRRYHYKWNEPEARKGYTDTQMKIYRPWIGTLVKYLDIRFEANEWEQKQMMMHCYVDVEFRDIAKRIILEVNINRPNYSSTTTGGDN